MPLCFPPPGAKGEPITRSASLSPFTSAARSVQPRLQYVSCVDQRARWRLGSEDAGSSTCAWLRWVTYLAGDGDVGGRRHLSSLGTKVDVHGALGEDTPGGREVSVTETNRTEVSPARWLWAGPGDRTPTLGLVLVAAVWEPRASLSLPPWGLAPGNCGMNSPPHLPGLAPGSGSAPGASGHSICVGAPLACHVVLCPTSSLL